MVQRMVSLGTPIQKGVALYHFSGESPLKKVMHLLKYQNKISVAKYFGNQLAKSLQNHDLVYDIDYIIAVPLHKNKMEKRGFNQANFIAEEISKKLKIPMISPVLRVKNTDSQTKKNKQERMENMKSAFEWKTDFPEYTHFLLVDDVFTTGATMWGICQEGLTSKYLFSVACIGLTGD
jgi:ComF family protein